MAEVIEDETEREAMQGQGDLLRAANDKRRQDKLRRQANRANAWRNQVAAQMELKIRQCNAALEAMGVERISFEQPDLGPNSKDAALHEYANKPIPK